jgi:hypothetical protein
MRIPIVLKRVFKILMAKYLFLRALCICGFIVDNQKIKYNLCHFVGINPLMQLFEY